jgi:hypothetical protein
MERLSREYRVSIAVPIMEGLLASGDFTYIDKDGQPRLKRLDMGTDWNQDGYARQKMSNVTLAALNLAKELVDQTELEAEKGV